MTNHPDRYYRSAGAVPFMGVLLMIGSGVVGAAICGSLYAVADWYIAFDVVPFICAPLAGAGIGLAVKAGAHFGRVRHRGFLAFVGLAMGVLGAYFAWVVFIRIWDGGRFWVWDPLILVQVIDAISDIGIWENQPTGVWLKVIYAIETLSITLSASVIASLESRPYCDPCNQWTKSIAETATLRLTDPEVLRERLENAEYEALDELLDPQTNAANCFHAKVCACPNCDESNYLTISHFTLTQKGNETQQTDAPFIKHLWVPRDVVDQVRRLATERVQTSPVTSPSDLAAAFKTPAESQTPTTSGEP